MTGRFDSDAVVNRIQERVQSALTQVGMAASGYAKQALESSHAVDTGALVGSVTYTVNGNTAIIGTNKEYAPYIEFGTGKYAEGGGGTSKESWVYRGEDGAFHRAFPQHPRPFIKPAIADHIDEYRSVFAQELSK